MKRLVNFLKNPIVLGLIGVIALWLVIFFGADFVKFGAENKTLDTPVRLILMLAVLLIWLVAQLITMFLSHRKNQGLMKAVQEPAVNKDAARADQEVAALNQRFNEGMAILKRARFQTAKGKVALYQLPWYIIIGPPGAGKTTALVNSGLQFPLANSHGKKALEGIGGTRNCDWWFTNEAVLIDTAGRYTTQDSHKVVDSSAWQGFLKLLKKYRPRRPVNGVLLAISVQDLLTQPAAQRSHQAKLIRERIEELQQQFGVRFPIYVMLTKSDLLAGFTEFFANLTQPEREQVWGVTFDPQQNNALDHIGSELDQLITRLNDRVLWRVQNERDSSKRARIQGFPLQVENLKATLESFLQETFGANRFSEAPLLRGLYFCSGTQEGTPIDRMMAAVSSNFGLARDAIAHSGSGKSFFINRLFRDVVIPEAELVGSNKKLDATLGWLRRGYYAALGLVFVGLIVVWSITMSRNSDYMAQVNAYIQSYQSASEALPQWDQSLPIVLPVLEPLRSAATVYDQNKHPWLSGVGLYDESVDQAADKLYNEILKKEFLPRFQFALEESLNRLPASDAKLMDTFRTYLMLATPEEFDRKAIMAWASEQWQQQLPGEAGRQDALKAHLAQVLEQDLSSVTLSAPLIASTRLKLKQIAASQRLYSQLKGNELAQQNVDLYAQIGGQGLALFGSDNVDLSLSALFSKPGYKSLNFDTDSDLLKQLDQDRWLYGDEEVDDFSEADKAALAQELETLYLNDYTQQWQSVLTQLHIAPYSDLNQATAAVKQMADSVSSPIVALLRVTKENTALTPGWPKPPLPPGTSKTVASVAGDAFDKAIKPTSVDVAFRDINELTTQTEQKPAPITEVLAGVKELHTYLNNMAVAPNANGAAFDAAKARYTTNSADAIRKLRVLASDLPEPVNVWLNEMADQAWAVVLQSAKAHLDTTWKAQVYEVYNKTLANRYPLRNVKTDATLDDFNQFFSAAGAEKVFVDANVKPFLDKNGNPKPLDGKTLAFDAASLSQLKAANLIRFTMFTQDGSNAGYRFGIKPQSLDTAVGKFELQLGSQRNNYSHGPKINKDFSWQAGRDNNVRILFEDLNGTPHRLNFESTWAWYRMLDAAKIQKTGNTTYRAVFNEDGRKAEYVLTSKSRFSGLNVAMLRNYYCPDHL